MQKIAHDADNRVQFLLDKEIRDTARSLYATVQDLELSNQGLRQENRDLKTDIEIAKGEAQSALDRFWIDFDEIKVDDNAKPLGRGATAVVLRAEVYGQRVAVKRVDAMSIDDLEEGAAILFRELKKISPLEHRNVIELIGGCWGFEEDELNKSCIVFELATRGSMRNYVAAGLSRTSNMLCDVARGMEYIHSKKVGLVHQDLKPENILLNAKLTAKVGARGKKRQPILCFFLFFIFSLFYFFYFFLFLFFSLSLFLSFSLSLFLFFSFSLFLSLSLFLSFSFSLFLFFSLSLSLSLPLSLSLSLAFLILTLSLNRPFTLSPHSLLSLPRTTAD